MRKKNHKQKDKTRDEIVKLIDERPGVRPSNSRSARGSRTLPGLLTQLLTGMPDRYKWLAQFSSKLRFFHDGFLRSARARVRSIDARRTAPERAVP